MARQKRAEQTRQKLLIALEKLLADREFADIPVVDIAGEAGVAVGSVYSHFGDKEAFLDALIETHRARVYARLDKVSQMDLPAMLRAAGGLRPALQLAFQSAFDQLREDAGLIRAIYGRKSRREDSAWDEVRAASLGQVQVIIDTFREEVKRPNRPETAQMLFYMMNTIFVERILFGERAILGPSEMADTALLEEVTAMAYGYLMCAD